MRFDLGAVGAELAILLAVEAVVALAALIAIGRWAHRERREAPADVPPVVGLMLNDLRSRLKYLLARSFRAVRTTAARGATRLRNAVPGADRILAAGGQEPERS